jgi:hypothetical protein
MYPIHYLASNTCKTMDIRMKMRTRSRTHSVIPISKKCRVCKTVKLLNEFEINKKTKDKHATTCKECVAKKQPLLCSCSCERCLDGKIMKSAFASMELLLSRIDNGLQLPDEMYMMIASLSHSTGVLCDNCDKELANK